MQRGTAWKITLGDNIWINQALHWKKRYLKICFLVKFGMSETFPGYVLLTWSANFVNYQLLYFFWDFLVLRIMFSTWQVNASRRDEFSTFFDRNESLTRFWLSEKSAEKIPQPWDHLGLIVECQIDLCSNYAYYEDKLCTWFRNSELKNPGKFWFRIISRSLDSPQYKLRTEESMFHTIYSTVRYSYQL